MKMLILIALLNAQTGDLDGYWLGGITENVATCHDAMDKAMQNGLAKDVPDGDIVDKLCIDFSKVNIEGLKHLPTEQPPTISRF